MKTRVCNKCHRRKSVSKFYVNHKSGQRSRVCKKCHAKNTNRWRDDHKDEVRKWAKPYMKKYRKEHPWQNTYTSILKRCNSPKCESYPRYGGRGIKNFLKPKDLEYLWYRDGADLMERPSIDRIDDDGHYTLKNCRYIEWDENVARRKKAKKFQELESTIIKLLKQGYTRTEIAKCLHKSYKAISNYILYNQLQKYIKKTKKGARNQ